MQEVETWERTAQILEVVYNVLLVIVPILVGLSIVTVSGASTVATIRKVAGYEKTLFDSPEDILVKALAKRANKKPEEVQEYVYKKIVEIETALKKE